MTTTTRTNNPRVPVFITKTSFLVTFRCSVMEGLFAQKKWREASDAGFLDGKANEEKLSLCTWLGYGTKVFKEKQLPVVPSIDLSERDKRIRVRVLWPWKDQEISCVWKKMMGDENIRFLSSDEVGENFTVVINSTDEWVERETTILFHMEPFVLSRPSFWGPAWSTCLERREFLATRFHDETPNPSEWHLSLSKDELLSFRPEKTQGDALSCVISSLNTEDGHKKRIEFLSQLQESGLVKTHMYGRDNKFEFKNYLGSLPSHKKDDGLFPYKYTFNAESVSQHNYFTEKIVDPILSETLCFYWGCPNISEFFDPRAFVYVDITRPQEAIQTIARCISDNEWEKRVEIIRAQKKRITNCLGFVPTLERILSPRPYESKVEMLLVELLFKEKYRGYFVNETIQKIPYLTDVMIWDQDYPSENLDLLCSNSAPENMDKINCFATQSELNPNGFRLLARTKPQDGDWKIWLSECPKWTWSNLPRRNGDKYSVKTFVVNLDRRTDRLEFFKKVNPGLVFERFPAIDGRNIGKAIPFPLFGKELVPDIFKSDLSGPVKGCCLSHAYIWQRFLDSTEDYLVVLEDDVILTLDFERKLQSILPFEGDIAWLGVSLDKGDLYSRSRDRTRDPRLLDFSLFDSSLRGGTFGMLITRAGVAKLLENLEKTGFIYPVDYHIFYNQGKYDMKVCWPFLAFSELAENTGDSDIQ